MDAGELRVILDELRTIGTDTCHLEVKEAAGGLPKGILATLSAFANGRGGRIILGVSEAEGFRPVGGLDGNAMQDAVAQAAREKLSPPLQPIIEIVILDGEPVVVVDVPALDPDQRPCHVKAQGRYAGSFLRAGDGNHRLSHYEIDRIIEQYRQPQWDREVVVGAEVSDLNPELLHGLLQRERTLHPRAFADKDDTTVRVRLGITAMEDGIETPTLAGLLALGEYPQQFHPQLMLSYAVYPGAGKSSSPGGRRFLDQGTLAGSIPDIVEDIIPVIQRNSRRGGLIDGVFREDLPDYDPVSIREAVTNALMHRDYSPASRGAQVQLNIFADDRLEIINPGGLYGPITEDSLGNGMCSSRNSVLAGILESTPSLGEGFIAENRGSGYQEILSRQERAMLPPPCPRDRLTDFTLIFKRREMTVPERAAAAGIPSRERILNHLRTVDAPVGSRELAAAAGISLSGARRLLSQMVKDGVVERLEPARSPKQRYRLR